MTQFVPYQPGRPVDVPAGYPLPVPRRPRVRAVLLSALLVAFLAACGLMSVLAITTETGVLGLATGIVLAAVPVFPVIAVLLWLDRYEAEPAHLLAFAFAWGAGVATFGALVINTASVQAIKAAGGDPTIASILVAPVVEESLKGLAVLLILLIRRREFDGIVDGVVYAGMAGVGFAFVENVLYLGRTMASSGTGGLVTIFLLRCVVSPFAHPLFTAATGVGLGIAVRTRSWFLRLAAPLLGWMTAMLLHAAWNLSAASGLRGFLTLYVVVQLPVLLVVAGLALFARAREGRLIARYLADYGSTGWLSAGEVAMLSSLAARREARGWAQRTGGPAARRAMRDFQELGSELAFLRERMRRGTAAADAPLQEQAMLAAMSAQRAAFLPRWAAGAGAGIGG